ncbi:MAG: UDP-N-acetylmuramoyl-tripeptide--D-alanyl-D-alanine ligase [Methylococcaceae bacterium]|nr:MAG: UDP-N-acetylmuramoyl-tripeptide--D-alanyl-D-alanine ligase [Methylococcaceae bacterium]
MPIHQIILAVFNYTLGVHADVLHDVHMLQQNSYRSLRYVRWLSQDFRRFLHLRQVLGFLPLALFVFKPIAALAAWCVLYPTLFATYSRPPAKLKLAFTPRVIRLLCAHAALFGFSAVLSHEFLPACFAFSLPAGFYLLFALVVLGCFSPVLLLLSNALVLPLEWTISRFYYYDAKLILAKHVDLPVIGITGSYGKTSTKLVLNQLLSTRFNSLATPLSYNTTMGVVRVIRTMLRPVHELFIVEMGARQPGDIKELCDLVAPKIGIITAIGEQHLETFGSIDAVTATKLELFTGLASNGMAFFNLDDVMLHQSAKPIGPRYISYGIDTLDADYRATDIVYSAKGTEFTVLMPQNINYRFHARLLGKHNVYNILAAIAVSHELGIPASVLAPAVAALPCAPHRLEIKRTTTGITILDDAFSSNPLGAKYALDVLATFDGNRKFLLTPGMVELGEREFALNKAFGAQAAGVCDYIILVGPKRAEPILVGLTEAGFPADQVYIAADLKSAQSHLDGRISPGDVVLYENDLPDTYNEV